MYLHTNRFRAVVRPRLHDGATAFEAVSPPVRFLNAGTNLMTERHFQKVAFLPPVFSPSAERGPEASRGRDAGQIARSFGASGGLLVTHTGSIRVAITATLHDANTGGWADGRADV